MGIKDQPTIMFDAPDAAHYQTGIKGWVSRQGHYFGDGPQSEDMARYDGCTHVACRKCGAPTKKGWTACNSCREDAEIAEYEAMPRAEWDGKAMLYSQAFDTWYESPDEAREDLGDDADISVMRLVIGEPVYVRRIESDYFADELADDQDLPGEVLDAMDAFNKAVAWIVLSWEPGKKALK